MYVDTAPIGDPSERDEQRFDTSVLVGGSLAAAMFALAAIVLTALALAGRGPRICTALAGISDGLAMIFAGAALGARWKHKVEGTSSTLMKAGLVGGVGADVLGGTAGIMLSAVALGDYAPHVMIAIAAMALGTSLLVGAGAVPEIARLSPRRRTWLEPLLVLGMDGSGALLALCGLAAIVLGILAMSISTGYGLAAVAMLVMGVGLAAAGLIEALRFLPREA